MKNACVVILCHMPLQWTTDYVNQTAYELAKHNTVICYRPFSSMPQKRFFSEFKIPRFFHDKKKNIHVYESVQFIPGRRFRFVNSLNEFLNVMFVRFGIRILFRGHTSSVRLLWFFHPSMYEITTLFGRSFQTVYDCVDYWTGSTHLTKDERQVLYGEEQKSIRGASVVAVNSHVLYQVHKRIRKDILLVPQGFRLETFSRVRTFERHTSHTSPVAGYIGTVNDRLDVRLLVRVASVLKRCKFVLVGPVMDMSVQREPRFMSDLHTLLALPNVFHMGNVTKEEIPGIIGQFDIGIIPYRTDSAFNRNCYPMKLYEYFYMGKPVVSTPIAELRRFPEFVYMGDSADEWARIITSLLAKPWPVRYQKTQRNFAMNNSWERKVSRISSVVEHDKLATT